jgi:hypothetical protein
MPNGCPCAACRPAAPCQRQSGGRRGTPPPRPYGVPFPEARAGPGQPLLGRGRFSLQKGSRNSGVLPDSPGASGHCSCRRWPAAQPRSPRMSTRPIWNSSSNPGGARAGWLGGAPVFGQPPGQASSALRSGSGILGYRGGRMTGTMSHGRVADNLPDAPGSLVARRQRPTRGTLAGLGEAWGSRKRRFGRGQHHQLA